MTTAGQAPSPDTPGMGEGVRSLVRTLRTLFFCLRLLIVFIFVLLLFSGVFHVDEQEEALLFHFGKLQEREVDPQTGRRTAVLTSGRWYWAWPYPIDSRKMVPAQKSVTVSTEDMYWPQMIILLGNEENITQGMLEQPLRPGESGYLLTGDTNIMHMVWTVTYRVTDARKYYLDFYDDAEREHSTEQAADDDSANRGVEVAIRSILASAALAEVGTWAVEDVLVASRPVTANAEQTENLKDRVRNRVEAKVEELGLGIEIQQVNLVDVRPPLATQRAFREVNEAAAIRSALISNAEAYAETVIPQAEGHAAEILGEAESYRVRIVESVKSDSSYFQTVLKEYRRNPKTMLVALYADAIRDVLQSVETKYIVHGGGDGQQEIRLLLGPEPRKPFAKGDEDTE